ncbi:MAG: rhodanese-like domain-containing protein, partial [Thiolinea sp.]
MRLTKLLGMTVIAAGLAFSGSAFADGKPVNITPGVMSVKVKTPGGEEVEIMRNQDNAATINPAFAKTSRPCPPFCIQPDVIAQGVQT